MAVFVCLLLVTVLLPATALGLSSYTRSTVQAEKSRSADSGALAGAASLALIDATGIPANPLQAVSKDGIAFTKACTAANKAADKDDALSEDYAKPVSCFATYSPDTFLAQCADDILGALNALGVPTGPVTVPVPTLPPIVPPLLPPPPTVVPPIGPVTVDPRVVVRTLVPALLHNGIKVTMTYRVDPPLDGLFKSSADKDRQAISTARRRFKPLIPPGVLGAQETLVVTTLQSLLTQLKALVGTNPAGVLPGVCTTAVTDVIDDLSDALQVTTDPEDTDLLECVGGIINGLDLTDGLISLLPSVDLDCTDQLFRAQLAPNA